MRSQNLEIRILTQEFKISYKSSVDVQQVSFSQWFVVFEVS